MNETENIRLDILEHIKSSPAADKLKIVEEYTPALKECPLKSIYAVLSCGEAELTPFAVGDDIGGGQKGKRLDFCLRLTVYAPQKLGGKKCGDTLRFLLELISAIGNINIVKISSGLVNYEPAAGAFKLGAVVSISSIVNI